MLQAEITIQRSSRIVWNYFTKAENWAKWHGGDLRSAQWRKGGALEWELGSASTIKQIVPGKRLELDGQWLDSSYSFEPIASDSTLVKWRQGPPKGGAYFSDGGTSTLTQMKEALEKLKYGVEGEANVRSGSGARRWWKSWAS